MLKTIHLQDFKGHRDTTLALGPLTALVGDNASGKTSVLEALELLSMVGEGSGSTSIHGFVPGDVLRSGADKIRVEAIGSNENAPWRVQLTVEQTDGVWQQRLEGEVDHQPVEDQVRVVSPTGGTPQPPWQAMGRTLGRARLYSLNADRIARAAYSADANVEVAANGSNTSVVLSAMKLEDDRVFTRIESALRRIVPSLAGISLKRAEVQEGERSFVGNQIYFDFHGAPNVPAHSASHGTLLVLSLLTVLYGPSRPNLVLLDNFDHVLHPRAQMELVKLLKQLPTLPGLSQLQVVATTHSPYFLDELEPEQVYAFALRPDGTVATKTLDQHPEAAHTKGMLSTGQLWSLDPERNWVVD